MPPMVGRSVDEGLYVFVDHGFLVVVCASGLTDMEYSIHLTTMSTAHTTRKTCDNRGNRSVKLVHKIFPPPYRSCL